MFKQKNGWQRRCVWTLTTVRRILEEAANGHQPRLPGKSRGQGSPFSAASQSLILSTVAVFVCAVNRREQLILAPPSRLSNRLKLATLLAAVSLFCAGAFAGSGNPATNAAVIVSMEGTVEIQHGAGREWIPAQVDAGLGVGDQLRTGQRSRATLRLANYSVLRVGELMVYEIEPPRDASGKPVINVKSGQAYFFSRDKPQEIQLRTPTVTGAIRGTEFNLAVEPDGRTTLTMLDGEVDLTNNMGSVALFPGEQGVAEAGRAPVKTAVLNAVNIIQWNLYYPGILDPGELDLDAQERAALAPSLAAYQQGDLLAALNQYPTNRQPASAADHLYLGELLLSVGLVDETVPHLDAAAGGGGNYPALANSLRELITAVKFQTQASPTSPKLATEFLAESYYQQSRGNLTAALAAARGAVEKSPSFGFARERVAELEFSFGHTDAALEALNKGLALTPRNPQALALKGFLLSAQNRISEAVDYFDEAIAVDGSLGNAWLGRGLCRIRRGQAEAGREDLEVAAALEPNRAVLRSYLGKAFSETRDNVRAEHELELARKLDPNDPTSWLYSALLHQQQNQINQAIRDLEESETLNDNRRVYRSQMLLDQDAAVRGANLAGIYQDAGMDQVSVVEATRAVNSDYANYSAHLFLANSYNQLRDPNQINLRYETPWLSEFLVANLLAPVGAGTLSQNVSQQEYSKLFEHDRFGAVSSTEYLSRGAWRQGGSQYGNFGSFGYAVDENYLSDPGQRANEDQRQLTLSVQMKEQLSTQDAIYFQSIYYNATGGDLTEYYDQTLAHTGLRTKETQEPLLLAGYHHEWFPGMHTLVLAGRFQDTSDVTDPQEAVLLLAKNGAGQVIAVPSPALPTAPLTYQSKLELYSAEVQQIWQQDNHGVVVGARYQTGTFNTSNFLGASTPTFLASTTATSAIPFSTTPIGQEFKTTMQRITGYGYGQIRLLEPLLFSTGVSYDYLQFPQNFRTAPVASGEDEKGRISPKAGLTWTPGRDTAVRFAYTRSLGGVSFDQSARLEPSQVAGFTQAYRSLIPESISGSTAGATFETYGLAVDQKFRTGTYVEASAELLNSEVNRTIGTVDLPFPPNPVPSGTRERLKYREQDLSVTLNQLVGDDLSLGARYQLSRANLRTAFPDIPATVSATATVETEAMLHQVSLFALFNHSSGFYARAEGNWYSQSNGGDPPTLAGDSFWQLNLFGGWRLFHRQLQLQVGVLNLTDHDYQLNPLNLYTELPRHRTFEAGLQMNF